MTAWGSVELAVQAIRSGARDFVEKPWDNERLLSILRTQVELCRALRRGQRLEAENIALRDEASPTLIATSPAMEQVLELIAKIGPSDANVLITGEHGTGKEVVARRLHRVSERAEQPLITVNVGGLPEGVFASELFGHVKGAFTDAKGDRMGRFEMADRATLFLDEIANVPFHQQGKLLRTLETGELERIGSSKTRTVDARILSATNADLVTEVAGGRFREDLLFRLNTVEIPLPPLRDRPEDIPVLAMHFLGRVAEKYRKAITGFDEAAMTALKRHPWPGNVRELAHVVERAVLMASGEVIRADHLGLIPTARTSAPTARISTCWRAATARASTCSVPPRTATSPGPPCRRRCGTGAISSTAAGRTSPPWACSSFLLRARARARSSTPTTPGATAGRPGPAARSAATRWPTRRWPTTR